MDLQVARIQISNFRGIQSGTIDLSKHTVLIGTNNCGKTTVIEALALLLGRDKMIRSLTEHDFYGSSPKQTDRIKIISTIINFYSNTPEQNPEWFSDGRGIPKWIDYKTGIVKPIWQDEKDILCCQIAFSARFDFKNLEVETIRYFHDDDSDLDVFENDAYSHLYAGIIKKMGFYLIPANRSWDKIISFSSELFRRLINADGATPSNTVLGLRDKLRSPEFPLEDDGYLKDIVGKIDNEVARFFSTKPKLKLRLTPTDSDGILEAVIPHFCHSEKNSFVIPSRRQGSGLISLQSLLLLLQFGKRRNEDNDGFIMALEEPELHVPPSLQMKLVNRVQALSTQTIITTHSPTIAAAAAPTNLVMLQNIDGTLKSQNFLKAPLSTETPNAIRKLYYLNRAETISALMHDHVLIPEGRSDYEILNLLFRLADLTETWDDTDEAFIRPSVGIIPTHDAAIKMTYESLVELHPSINCLVDGDTDGKAYSEQLSAMLATKTLRWPDNWTIEDILGWILEADAVKSLSSLRAKLSNIPESINDLVIMLKSNPSKVPHGMKLDQIAYESVVETIFETAACAERAKKLIGNICQVLHGSDSDFTKLANNQIWVLNI